MYTITRIALSCLILFAAAPLPAQAADEPFLVGRAIADVTGPARGIQMWGFVREGQITEGIHTRLYARAFIIAEHDTPADRVAIVSVDIGSTTHDMQLEVVDRLQALYGDTYTMHNVILTATHTHAGPGGYWHWGGDSPLGTQHNKVHFEFIVNGIVTSIQEAHESLAPGSITYARGVVEGAGANRSLPAYEANPAEERAQYDANTDKGMTLLKLSDGSGPVGMINWFASHPTAMTFDNKLISGDHKGHASAEFEASQPAGFVAAFAQSNCGDVTPNLNLNNTGPGENEFETTRIIAERQLEVAQQLFASADTPLSGQIESHQIFVDFKYHVVDAAYTDGHGPQRTCPSVIGYAMAAGSTEDGGGHPLFKEGMTERNGFIDGTVKNTYKAEEPSDECRECHGNKPALFSTGEPDPPLQTQVLPFTLTRIGALTFASVPAEVTTMAGRRLRTTIAAALETTPDTIIIVGYANDYTGYITTREEYDTQQYEGGHTLFGPWSLAAYQQEFDRLARAIHAGDAPESQATHSDKRGTTPSYDLIQESNPAPAQQPLGTITEQPKKQIKTGETVQAIFVANDPRYNFPQAAPFIAIQRNENNTWTTIASEREWSTKIRWIADPEHPETLHLQATWDIPESTPPGEYRITYQDGANTATTNPFKVK